MIRKEDSLLLGTISKPHGTKGSLLLWLRNIKAEDIKKWESVFVDIDGLLVPFFIESFKANTPDSLIVKFEGVLSETEAKTFAGKDVYAASVQIKKKRHSESKLSDLKGYKVIDVISGFIGIAGEIADIEQNPLLIVHSDQKEYLIPVHEDIVLEIDKKAKEIRIQAPEGLLDLN
jgi:16S rRNA processing protein RimM